jgi:Zn-dependent protease
MEAVFTNTIFSISVLIISIIIHEVAHGYAAFMLGDVTAKLSGRLTMNPLKHIDPVGSVLLPGLMILTQSNILFGWAKPVPYNPHNLRSKRWGEAIVAAAGGVTNIFIALLFATIAQVSFANGFQSYGELSLVVSFINLFLGMFNLLPLPPLDGYTVLRGVLPLSLNHSLRRFEDHIAHMGIFGLVLFLFVFSLFFSIPFFAFVRYIFSLIT